MTRGSSRWSEFRRAYGRLCRGRKPWSALRILPPRFIEGQLEELLAGAHAPLGLLLGTTALECERRLVVALIPAGRRLDRREDSARAAACSGLRDHPSPRIPLLGRRPSLLEQTVLTDPTLWLEERGHPGTFWAWRRRS